MLATPSFIVGLALHASLATATAAPDSFRPCSGERVRSLFHSKQLSWLDDEPANRYWSRDVCWKGTATRVMRSKTGCTSTCMELDATSNGMLSHENGSALEARRRSWLMCGESGLSALDPVRVTDYLYEGGTSGAGTVRIPDGSVFPRSTVLADDGGRGTAVVLAGVLVAGVGTAMIVGGVQNDDSSWAWGGALVVAGGLGLIMSQ